MPDAIYECHLKNTKAFPEGSHLKQVLQAVVTGILLLVTLLFLLLGVASITETSRQTVDSGQVEDTRWSEESSDVVKVNVFLLVVEQIVLLIRSRISSVGGEMKVLPFPANCCTSDDHVKWRSRLH